ncbi:MAG: hypothetical protein ACRDYB_01110 [Acidimicrobiales bacterium]
MHNNRKWIAAAVAVIVVAAIAAITSGGFSTQARPAAPGRVAAIPTPPSHTLRPAYSPPSQGNGSSNSTQQRSDDAKIAASNDNPAQWSVVNALNLPDPAPSAQFPAIPHASRQGPERYAIAFVTELLSINFATQARPAQLSWAVSETSPDSMPGTPTSTASKVLYADLASSGGPIPAPTQWTENAAASIIWSVSDVTMTSAPIWTEALATGWQPPDPRMDGLDVTGDLTVTQTGQLPVTKPFALQLGLGTAEYHHGYGAMSVNNWTLG